MDQLKLEGIPVTQTSTTGSKILKGGFLALLVSFFVVFGDELLLAGPIIFLTQVFGLVIGGMIFAMVWAAIGLAALELVTRKHLFEGFFSSSPFARKAKDVRVTWRDQLVLWGSRIAKTFGALVAAVVLGPVLGWPAFKWLGYSKKAIYGWTLVAAPIFTLIWVPIYGGVGFLLFKLF